MRKNQKRYIPKKNLTDPVQIRKMLGSMIDDYDHGLDLGDKQIVHINTKSKLNSLFVHYKKPNDYHIDSMSRRFFRREQRRQAQARKEAALNSNDIDEHMNQINKRYYTSDPLSPYMMQGWDTDNRTKDPDRVIPFRNFYNLSFPSFSDSGSSSKSSHHFPKFYMVPLYDYYEELYFNNQTTLSWAKYANRILSKISYVIKTYGQTIIAPDYRLVMSKKTHNIKPEYLVEFDAIKGTYPEYKYRYYRDRNDQQQSIITKINTCGILFKLPNLFTEDDVRAFIDAPVYSILDLLTWAIYLVNQLLLCSSVAPSSESILSSSDSIYSSFLTLSPEQVDELLNISAELETVLKAHNISFPSISREKNAVASNQAQGSSDTLPLNQRKEKNKDYVYMPGHFPVETQKPHFQGKNKETLKDINNEPNVLKRSTRYLYYLYIKYALEGKELTEFEEYRVHYRIEAGTGEETPANIKRLKYVWNNNIDRMKKYVYGGLKGRIDSLETEINQILTQDEINNIRDSRSSFRRRIYPRDIASAALWIFVTLTNDKYLQMKNWTALYANNINQNKELTAPMVSLEGFLNTLKEKELLRNGCDPKKAKALREILIHVGWIECIDNSYDFIQAHRSMRYILTEKHPYYKEFEKVIGKNTLEYWENVCKKKKKMVG